MLGVLNVIRGPDAGSSYNLGRNQKATVGRATSCSVRLNDAQVSRAHCELNYSGDRVVITDAGSGSGTRVNGTVIEGPHELQSGDVIVVGQTAMSFQWSDDDQKPTVTWKRRKAADREIPGEPGA